ncbi:hypothetical protein [Herbiconiux solani]|uniref:hypothetical protein n=1 Tax=Herbiconiux solani TaxID=661329 RepID=UPI0008242800|nr:hypothetical protein [Herbiconiux solani]
MEALPVDPRDVVQREIEPVYRVTFWMQPSDGSGAHSWEWRISGADDVFGVIAWAELKREGRSYEMFVEQPVHALPSGAGVRLVRLSGFNPTRSDRAAQTVAFRLGSGQPGPS